MVAERIRRAAASTSPGIAPVRPCKAAEIHQQNRLSAARESAACTVTYVKDTPRRIAHGVSRLRGRTSRASWGSQILQPASPGGSVCRRGGILSEGSGNTPGAGRTLFGEAEPGRGDLDRTGLFPCVGGAVAGLRVRRTVDAPHPFGQPRRLIEGASPPAVEPGLRIVPQPPKTSLHRR